MLLSQGPFLGCLSFLPRHYHLGHSWGAVRGVEFSPGEIMNRCGGMDVGSLVSIIIYPIDSIVPERTSSLAR